MAKKILGIDLGTTYSCIAYINETGQPEIIPNAEDERTTPSVVWFDGKRAVVGQEAKGMAPVEFNNVCSFVKRNMGNDEFFFEAEGTRYLPEHVSSLILRKLVKDASERLDETITDVVITCPAYFFIKERDATKRAGEMAGLSVLQIVNEPTAAAVAYGIRAGANEKDGSDVLVYDLGGGTFDVTLIHVTPNGLDVICTDGDHQLGGKDWDDRLVQYFLQRFTEETGTSIDPSSETATELYYDLMLKAEQVKKQLTPKSSTPVSFVHEGEKVRIEVTRDEFEQMTQDLVTKTITLTHGLLDAAKTKGVNKFDKFILVGGSSKMPQIMKAIEAEFSVKPVMFEPDEAVAKGAAIIGNNIQLRKMIEEKLAQQTGSRDLTLDVSNPQDVAAAAQAVADEMGYTLEVVQNATKSVRNVTSKSFGETCVVGYDHADNPIYGCVNLIYRNTPIPTSKSERFTTTHDNQLNSLVEVVENMHDLTLDEDGQPMCIPIEECTTLWKGLLPMTPGLPKGSPTEDTYFIDENGLLTITSVDLAGGNKLTHEIQTGHIELSESANPVTKKCRDLAVE